MSDLFARTAPGVNESDDPQGRYLGQARVRPGAQPTLRPAHHDAGEPGRGGASAPAAATSIGQIFRRIVQACRLVVGIHDYQQYLAHMHSQHPEVAPLTREEFYRRCIEARYPGTGRGGSGCPC